MRIEKEEDGASDFRKKAIQEIDAFFDRDGETVDGKAQRSSAIDNGEQLDGPFGH